MSYLSRTTTVADGVQTAFPVSFPYQQQADVDVYVHVAGAISLGLPKVVGVDYDWTSSGIITFRNGKVPAAGNTVDIRRSSTVTALDNTIQAGGSLRSDELLQNDTQLLYLMQEAQDAGIDAQASFIETLGLPFLRAKDQGAKGDGIADDYQAWMDIAAIITGSGGGIVICEPGATYKFDRFLTATNGLLDPIFKNFKGLLIEGNGAKFAMKGGWDRDASTSRSFCPMRFQDGYNLVVRNLELYGASDTITNSSGAGVPYSHGLSIESCERAAAENIYSHHHIADGTRIDTSPTFIAANKHKASRFVKFSNVVSKFNVRLGLSLIQGRGVVLDNCDFSYSAYNDEAGTATGFLNGGGPKAGIDIEPGYTTFTATFMDYNTGDIVIRNSRLFGSNGQALSAAQMTSGQYRMDNVLLDNCSIDVPVGKTDVGFEFEVPEGKITNCKFNMRDSFLDFGGYNAAGFANEWFTHNTVYGNGTTGNGVFTSDVMAGGRTVIESNTFVDTSTVPSANPFIRVLNTLAAWRGNKVTLLGARYVDSTSDDREAEVRLNCAVAEGNHYTTNLLASAGSSGTANFGVYYGDATVARNERFTGDRTVSVAGWADTIRPGKHSTALLIPWDTNRPFNSNQRMALVQAYNPASLATNAATAITTTAVGDAAMNAKVDITFSLDSAGVAWNGNVSSAGNVKWWGVNQAGTNPLDLAAGDITILVTNPTL